MKNCHRYFNKFIFTSCLITVCFAVISLFGWYLNAPDLQNKIPGTVPMHPLTGLTFLFCAFSLNSLLKPKGFLYKIVVPILILILVIALLRILQIAGLIHFRLDLLLFGEVTLPDAYKGIPRGMAPNTAICFFLIGLALLCIWSQKTRVNQLGHFFSILSASLSFISVIGYLFGNESFYRYSTFLPMALSSAFCFFLISISILLIKTDKTFMFHLSSDHKGGHLARLLLPFSILVPLITGWIFVVNSNHEDYQYNYGMALFAFAMMLLLIIMIWIVATRVNYSERLLLIEIQRREKAEEELKKRMEAILITEQVQKQKELVRTAISAQEKERREIGMDLHDNINQILTSIKLMLDMASNENQYREDFLKKASKSIILCIAEIRALSKALVPPKIDDSNLKDAISDLIEGYRAPGRMDIELDFPDDVMVQLSEEQGLAMFRIIQEQMNNIVRHAEASVVYLSVWQRSGMVYLRICDNGRGFDTGMRKKGIGLSNMDNRAQMLQGQLLIESRPESGCSLELSFPILIREYD